MAVGAGETATSRCLVGVGAVVGVDVNVGTIASCDEGEAEASRDAVAPAGGDRSARVGVRFASANLGGI